MGRMRAMEAGSRGRGHMYTYMNDYMRTESLSTLPPIGDLQMAGSDPNSVYLMP